MLYFRFFQLRVLGDTSCQLEGLQASLLYSIYVKSFNKNGEGSVTPTITVQTGRGTNFINGFESCMFEENICDYCESLMNGMCLNFANFWEILQTQILKLLNIKWLIIHKFYFLCPQDIKTKWQN